MKNFMNEFKKFISRGNVMDMAVGVIIGGAFTAIVNSLVNDIFMPLLSLITGGFDIAGMSVSFGVGENAATLNYGAFLSAVINFLLIALVIFCIIKAMNTAKDKMIKKPEEPKAPTTKRCPYCMSEIDIKATRCPHCTSEV
ncbi:large conductance mechanosensitive channel protein MscL [Candidatus Merdisoma sp. HCP28S3_D10]|uniref:large conductance mechanosensitive channel protein MscL n=1 Tax=unclassified Candidatus Merdisoma TaxID=3099611 RepID=UPI003F8CC8BB